MVISVPPYFEYRTSSPSETSIGTRFPSSETLPSPTASTLPRWGFSFAVSGGTRPLAVASPSSTALTISRSPRGFSFMSQPPSKITLANRLGTLARRVPRVSAAGFSNTEPSVGATCQRWLAPCHHSRERHRVLLGTLDAQLSAHLAHRRPEPSARAGDRRRAGRGRNAALVPRVARAQDERASDEHRLEVAPPEA